MAEKEKIIKSKATDYYRLEIDSEDGTPPVVWKLCYDYPAIAKIEDETGLDLKRIENWQGISSGHQFPKIVWSGLHRYHPEVTLDEVLDKLNPWVQREISAAIFDLMFPGYKEACERVEAELRAAQATGATASPNVVTAPSV